MCPALYRLFTPLMLLLLSSVPTHSIQFSDIHGHASAGVTHQYARFEQPCMPREVGFMAGPTVDLLAHYCWFSAYAGFRGLWDVAHITARNGLFVDARELQANLHLGYRWTSECKQFTVTPFTGIDYIQLNHMLETSACAVMIGHQYKQINVPLGITCEHTFCDTFNWGIKAYYDIDVWNRLALCTPDVHTPEQRCIKLKRGDRVYIETPVNWHCAITDCIQAECTLAPLFSWQRFGAAECAPEDVVIPKRTIWHVGALMSFGVRF